MTHHRCISLDSPIEWENALRGINHAFAHTWAHCYAMYLTTNLKTYLYCFELNDIRIVCPFAEREFSGYIDIVKPFGFSGFVGNTEFLEFKHHWKEFVQAKGYVCGYLGFNPIFDYSTHFNVEEISQYGTAHLLDLTLKIDELFSNLSRGRRKQLRNWSEIYANLVFDEFALRKFLLENYVDFLRRKNAAPFYFFSRESLLFLLNLENIVLVGAKDEGRIVAVSLFTYTSATADCFLHVSLPEGQYHSTALIWYGVHRLRDLQIPLLNLGGGSDEGITEYKRYFGGRSAPLLCLKQIYNLKIYNELCEQVDAYSDNVIEYFPRYRKFL